MMTFCLFFFLSIFVYSQTELESDCKTNLENIFKAHSLKIKYETVLYIHNAKSFPKNDSFLNRSFELIKGYPYFKEEKEAKSEIKQGELEKVEWMSKEEMDRYIEQLDCTPEQALKEYIVFLQNIRLKKELYLKCIDVELTKGTESEFIKHKIFYSFRTPSSSLLPPMITKLDFLKLFKKFIFIDDEPILPSYLKIKDYLK